MNTHPKKN